jgi:SAM-dependent methyltransferase
MAADPDVFRHRRLGGSAFVVDETISERDDMLTVLREHLEDDTKARMAYLSLGYDLVQTVERIARWRFGRRLPELRVLEFAAGHGRNVRHLVRVFPPGNVAVSDIQLDAVAFCEQQFGVSGFPSAHDPDALEAGRRFDLIIVPDLFSHLPDTTFSRWIRALHGLLDEGGLLVFSVHGNHLQAPAERAAAGITFVAQSESQSLDKAEYGTSHVSAAYVRAQIATATGHRSHALIRRGFWNHQDVYLVPRDEDETVDAYEHDYGVISSLDVVALTREGHLELSGWATRAVDGVDHVQVRVLLDGLVVAQSPARINRDQVAAAWGPAGRRSGFWFLIPNAVRFHSRDSALVVEAIDGDEVRCVWAGPLGVALTADAHGGLAAT